MITFGYKSSLSSNLRAYAAICLGMVLLPGMEGPDVIVRVIAGVFCALGVMSFLSGLGAGNKGYMVLMSMNAILDIAVGVVLAFWPELIFDWIIIILAAALVLLGLLEIIVAISTRKYSGKNTFGVVLSAIVFIGGAVLLAMFFLNYKDAIATAMGVVLLIYGFSELVLSWKVSKAIKTAAEKVAAEAKAATEVDDQPQIEQNTEE